MCSYQKEVADCKNNKGNWQSDVKRILQWPTTALGDRFFQIAYPHYYLHYSIPDLNANFPGSYGSPRSYVYVYCTPKQYVQYAACSAQSKLLCWKSNKS